MNGTRTRLGIATVLAVGAIGLSGCGEKHLLYVQEATLGLNIAVGTEGNQKMSFGYDRDIYSVVPKACKEQARDWESGEECKEQAPGCESGDEREEQAPDCESGEDVMSLLSLNHATVSGLDNMNVSEFVATGQAAVELSKKPNAVNELRNKIYGAGEH